MQQPELVNLLQARMKEKRREARSHLRCGNTSRKWHAIGQADALSEILEALGHPPDPYRGQVHLW